ncbi:hypothetical protein IE53DRAFT_385779 [Violaceomyces palustris]|uniref:Uncharacterized protein n=1 Tax=Violaceomyces palustris TaxID=1673888 RepID=A0ACD0P1A1_9BASI|nr:hypothetical protein IE53DRAFT_385779 [Violaceomyces palustris]
MNIPSASASLKSVQEQRFLNEPEQELDEATPTETSQALAKSRKFLVDRLLPDLETAQRRLDSIATEIQELEKLRVALRELDLQSDKEGVKDGLYLSDLGEGVALQAGFSNQADPIISIGRGNFLQLTNKEARAFISSKLKILERRKEAAYEKVAQIEAHVHLTSTSISQLDALHKGGSLIDGLQTA